VGFDPGSRVTGYGVIVVENRRIKALEYGIIKTDKKNTLSQKLKQIHGDAVEVLDLHSPEEVIVENAFYAKNVHSAMILGHVRGVLLLAGEQRGAHVVELSPKEIKRFVTGNVSASNERVKYMTCKILGLAKEPESEDASDALAAALAHALSVSRG
jgi:crossover junction endodeoxyribonuclease RuvC